MALRSLGVAEDGEAVSEMLVRPLTWSLGAVGREDAIAAVGGGEVAVSMADLAASRVIDWMTMSIKAERNGRPAAPFWASVIMESTAIVEIASMNEMYR